MDFIDLGIDLKGNTSGQIKTLCPKCSHKRKAQNQKEPCLSVNIDEGIYNCHNCSYNGTINARKPKKVYARPEWNITDLSDETVNWFKGRGISQSTLLKHVVCEETSYMPQLQESAKCIVFNYSRTGELINKKYRGPNKSFKMVSGAELIFYGLDNIGESVIITEGEIDALSFDEAGFGNAISVPNGASKGNQKLEYLSNCYEEFSDVKKIYLACDSDNPGQELMHELARRLGRERCFIVRYPEGCKDANEVLVQHGINAVKDCISNAEAFPIEGVINVNDFKQDIIDLYDKGLERGLELDLGHDFDKLLTIKTSMLYLVTGIPTHGKSTFVEWMNIRLASLHGWKVGMFSPEHYPLQYQVYRLAEMIVGKAFFKGQNQRMSKQELNSAIAFINDHFFFVRPEGEDFTLDSILQVGRNLVLRHGIKSFIIDPWNTIQHSFDGLLETQYIEKALNKLTTFKQVNDLAVFLIAHPTKIRKDQTTMKYEVPTLYDVSGSSNFYNKCDFGITVYRDFAAQITQIYVQKSKWRNLGEIGFCNMKYNPLNNRFDSTKVAADTKTILPKPVQLDIEDQWMPYADSDDDFGEVAELPPF